MYPYEMIQKKVPARTGGSRAEASVWTRGMELAEEVLKTGAGGWDRKPAS